MEQKRPADIFAEALYYLWNGLGLEEKGWKRLKKGDFKKKMKNGLTYQVWFDRSRYNYIDYEIGYGNVEVGFSCIIKQGDDRLYSFKIEPTTGGSFFRMLTEDLRLNTRLLDTFLPLIKAHYLDFIDRFEVDPAEALQPVCAPFIQPGDYSWCIHVREQMVERYGTAEQLEEYRRQAELLGTPEHKAKNWMGSMLFHLSHANDVDHAWASSRTKEELDQVVEPFVQAKILTEVPEMFGAETLLMNRCENEELFEQTVNLINDFKQYFKDNHQTIYENPSPGNKKGGISTLEDKSLGCTQKSGSAAVKGVLSYGERVHTPGLNLLSAPGNDLVAATALAASGAHIVLFTTGRGTPFASPVPTVKISSNSTLAGKKKNWIDFNAGVLVEDAELEETGQKLFDYVIDVASGKKVRSEEAGFHDMAIFKQGVTL